jgi:hypothetical protein
MILTLILAFIVIYSFSLFAISQFSDLFTDAVKEACESSLGCFLNLMQTTFTGGPVKFNNLIERGSLEY